MLLEKYENFLLNHLVTQSSFASSISLGRAMWGVRNQALLEAKLIISVSIKTYPSPSPR